jgi:SAM-dependent methyltransferase
MQPHDHHHDALPDLLDLDAEVLHEYHDEVFAWVRELTGARHRVLDLGAGTGTGALALARRFDADVIAVDASAPMLARLDARAAALGLAGRVTTVLADLDAGWPAVDPVDLVWASNSLHHMADPARVLTLVRDTLRPGGRLVVAELDSFPRFLPDDGLEERAHAALAHGIAHELPHLGADWGSRLAGAGFTVEAHRVFTIDLRPPLPAAAGRYAEMSLRRLRSGLDGHFPPADLAAFDALIDGVATRDDLHIRAVRSIWVAAGA